MTSPIQWNSVSWIGPRDFYREKCFFLILSSILTQCYVHPSWPIFCLPRKANVEFSLAREVTTGSYPFKVWAWVENNTVSDSSNHLFFCWKWGKLRREPAPIRFGSLSPLRRRRTICPSISKRAFARVSPDFAFFRHISRFFRVLTHTLLLKPLARSRSVARADVCGCGGVCVCVRVCVCGKTLKTQRKQREMRVVWCVLRGVVRWENVKKRKK